MSRGNSPTVTFRLSPRRHRILRLLVEHDEIQSQTQLIREAVGPELDDYLTDDGGAVEIDGERIRLTEATGIGQERRVTSLGRELATSGGPSNE
jgi:hypothetical protein